MVVVAPRSAKLVEAKGARFTLLVGYVFCLLGFLAMLLLWEDGSLLLEGRARLPFIGIGVGFAGTPASRSLTGSVPVTRAGMASGTADLQRDLGGAIMQSIFGALLTAGYAAAASAADRLLAPRRQGQRKRRRRADQVLLQRRQHGRAVPPNTSSQIIARGAQVLPAGRRVGLHRRHDRHRASASALVFFLFPKHKEELALLERFHAEDA